MWNYFRRSWKFLSICVVSHVLILFNFYRFGSSRVHPMQAVLLSTCSLYPFYPFNFLRGIYNVVEFFT